MTAESVQFPRPQGPRPEIPGYEIGEVIGRGATGVVHRARQLAVDREVALKILHTELSANPRLVRRLQREARTTARLAHPHVVSAIDMGRTDGRWWYAMEFVDGPSLALRLRQEGRLKEREVLRLFIPLCEALEHLWEHGVVHRDIKPANILIDRAGGARLADLGLAFADDDPSITKPGGTLGTPHYISPEQAVDPTAADVRSDIWSFGATLFHALCGRPPFAGESAAEILSGVLYARIEDPQELEPSLSKGLALVLRKCLSRDPDARYQNPHELLLDLERVRERRQPKVRRGALDPVARARADRRTWLGVAAVVLIAAATVQVVFDPFGRRGAAGGEGAEREIPPYAPLEELVVRAREEPALLAQHRRELVDLRPGLASAYLPRWEEVDRELRAELRERVQEVKRQVGRRVDERLAVLDFAAADETVRTELPRLVFERTGYRLGELDAAGASVGPWLGAQEARVLAAATGAAQELGLELSTWSGRRRAEAQRLVERQEWDAALDLLVEERQAILQASGFTAIRLPATLLEDTTRPVANELYAARREVVRAWEALDRELVRLVREWKELLLEELESGRPRRRAAEDLRVQLDRELGRRRLARERMPSELPIACLAVLERATAELAAREEELLEDDAHYDFDEAAQLSSPYLRERRYEDVAEIWGEVAGRLSLLADRTAAPWRAELERAARLRQEEARLLLGLLRRAAARVRELDRQRVDLRVGSITYSDVRILSGDEPLTDGFRLEEFPEIGTLDVRALPVSEIESLAALVDPDAPSVPASGLTPEDRLSLALFRFHEGHPAAARGVLAQGELPTEGLLGQIEPDLTGRVLDSLREQRQEREQRERDADRHLVLVFDAEQQARAPSNVLARIELLLAEYADLPAVRQRIGELRSLRGTLRDARIPSDEEELVRVFRPSQIEYPRLGRVRMTFDFVSRSVGAWQRGGWAFDGTGWIRDGFVEGWEDLVEGREPRLFLRAPIDPDSFEVEIEFDQVYAGPPQLVLVSVAGFHVALCGSGLPGPERRARYLVGTEDVDGFLARLRAGEGKGDADLIVPGSRHLLVLRGYRPAGRLSVELDGRLLREAQMLPPSGDDPVLEFRSWEPVRLRRVALEAGR